MYFPVLFIFSLQAGRVGRIVVRPLMTSGLPRALSFLLYRLSGDEDRMCGGRMEGDTSICLFLPQNVL